MTRTVQAREDTVVIREIWRRGGFSLVVPKEVLEAIRGVDRINLYNALESLITVQKYAAYWLHGYEHSISFFWTGLNPVLVIEVHLFPDEANKVVEEYRAKHREEVIRKVLKHSASNR